jgi:hypothetical protein
LSIAGLLNEQISYWLIIKNATLNLMTFSIMALITVLLSVVYAECHPSLIYQDASSLPIDFANAKYTMTLRRIMFGRLGRLGRLWWPVTNTLAYFARTRTVAKQNFTAPISFL